MKTIAFAARKGGCSKSTLVAHLAVEAAKKQPVTLIDTDSQQTLTAWWDDRQNEAGLRMVDVRLEKLAGELSNLVDTPGLVLIDTPPMENQTIMAVIGMADLVIIPCKPSPNDLRGVAATVEMCKVANKPFIFVIAQAIPRTNIAEQARSVLASIGRVVPTVMHNRVDYAASMADGRTAPELFPNGKAAAEVTGIWRYLSQQLSKTATK